VRREWFWGVAAAVALAAGAVLAEPYARLAAPGYAAVDRLIARAYPWTIGEVAVAPDPGGRGTVLRLIGEVRRRRGDPEPAALVVSRIQVGEVIETPIVFWVLLLAWPAANARERWWRLAVGTAAFLGLEAATTAVQLVHPLAETSALLARGSLPAPDEDPLTLWERWSRFLEAGGNLAVAAAFALATLAAGNAAGRSAARH
jgi:hypothetical protein